MSRDVVKKRGFLTTEKLKENCEMSLKSVVEDGAELYMENTLISDYLGRRYSYGEFNRKTNQLANCLQEEFGISKQEVDIVNIEGNYVVAILMENCADYFVTEMGVCKSGAVFSLINNNITGVMLTNALEESYPSLLICDKEYKEVLESIGLRNGLLKVRDRLIPIVWYEDGVWSCNEVSFNLEEYFDDNLDHTFMSRDVAGLLYTSGTTGGAKAAVDTHHVFLMHGNGTGASCMQILPKEVYYTCLPLYHIAGQQAFMSSIMNGGEVYVSRKFSTSRFWDEVESCGATYFNYIGEMMKYLLAQPEREMKHQVRLCVGNGLQGMFVEEVQRRFKLPGVMEYYGSTEGVIRLANRQLVPGMIGSLYRAGEKVGEVVKCDEDGNILYKDGKPVVCVVGEEGIYLARINSMGFFTGYYGRPEETEKKLLRDLFEEGDCWFNLGDVLRLHEDDYVSFVDRVGDSYRWKSENVSASEVASVLDNYGSIMKTAVYSMPLEMYAGRAGIAAIQVKEDVEFDLREFEEYVKENLPNYAIPRFIYFVDDVEITTTFKVSVKDVKRKEVEKDMLYFNDKDKRYLEVTDDVLNMLQKGTLRI